MYKRAFPITNSISLSFFLDSRRKKLHLDLSTCNIMFHNVVRMRMFSRFERISEFSFRVSNMQI